MPQPKGASLNTEAATFNSNHLQLNGPSVLSARRKALERFTTKETTSQASEAQRQDVHGEVRNCQKHEQPDKDTENHELGRLHNQLELYEIADAKRLTRRKEHYQDMLATRDRQLQQIKQAKKYEELVLQQLDGVLAHHDNRISLVFLIANLDFIASLMSYF
ncbi:hypothetical protein AJ78_03140 [Emergomyces pasteurianus Ep9510]|uniref:Uncharacterized protein n=1 Tax=Emergomyces pasteurianus Ep9510 TaxID=1447872 RepID=A0A1J9Q903_9EURO|nr:hypothetical protein AJ78_03140 [Emergomyces pasteurianus Ep9510]